MKAPLYFGLWIYRTVLILVVPLVLLRLWWRGQMDPAYQSRWRERFGFYDASLTKGPIWFHTVSAGETIAAAPTIRAMADIYRGDSDDVATPFLVTTMTPTGSAQVASLLGDVVEHCYAPYDFTFAVRHFLGQVRPRALVLMETEIWPNLILEAKAQGIPVILMNARLSEKSARGYQRIDWLAGPVFQALDLVACQTPEHVQRFADLGVKGDRLHLVGNVKYDLQVDTDIGERAQSQRQRLGMGGRRCWIAASTHPGEEEQVLRAHLQASEHIDNLSLILAPRHPHRAAELEPLLDKVAQQLGGDWCFYSELLGSGSAGGSRPWSIVLIDQMGVLMPLYRMAEVAFIGGTLVPRGGHNPIEPASLRTPVIAGPHNFNFLQVYSDLSAAGASRQVTTDTLTTILLELLNDGAKRQQMGASGDAVVKANKGAMQRGVELITPILDSVRQT
jgi:3-deoxy-D-manno-octulosonic-acid transferase